ncbi:MAG: hypothetical protein JRI97_09235 [Deltaproteobacteria bacterium]|nr:hypothetical protein [Deltaproteobacteria bacterium]
MPRSVLFILACALGVFLRPGACPGEEPPAPQDPCLRAESLALAAMEDFALDPDAGIQGLEQAAALCPQNRAIAYNLGVALCRAGFHRQAYEAWSALAAGGADERLAVNLGRLALDLGDFQSARRWAREAGTMSRNSPRAVRLGLDVLTAQGRYSEALDLAFGDRVWLEKADRKKVVEAAVQSAFAVFRAGEPDRAARLLDRWADCYEDIPRLDEARDLAVAALLDGSLPLPEAGKPVASPAAPAAAGLSPGAALVVGIARYRHMEGLSGADADAGDMAWALSALGGMDPKNVRFLANGEATFDRLAMELDGLERLAAANPDYRVVVFFSGLLEPVVDGEGVRVDELFLTHEAKPGDPETGRLSLGRVAEALGRAPGAVVLVDGCWRQDGVSANDLVGFRLDPAPGLAMFPNLARSAAMDRKTRRGTAPGSLFSWFFLKALSGVGDADENHTVDAKEAFLYAGRRLSNLGLTQNLEPAAPPRLDLVRVGDP